MKNTTATLRWGILGAARIAAAYAKAIPASRNGRISAVASRDTTRARTFADTHAIPRVHNSYEALLADPEIDAVYVALPNALHAEWSIRALQAGKHVLCEKPLATCASDAERMRTAADEAGRILAEGIMYRLHPVNSTAIGMLQAGRIGELVSVNATFFAPVGEEDPIRFSADLGGGALLDLGIYCVSLMRWAAGTEPLEVHGTHHLHPGGVDFWTAGVMKFPAGAVGTFSCAYGTPFACRYELVGRTGRIVCDGGPLCAWPGGEFSVEYHPVSGETEIHKAAPSDHYQLLAEAFADAVHGIAPLPWTLEESIANLRTLDRLVDSARHTSEAHRRAGSAPGSGGNRGNDSATDPEASRENS